jgi:hypothetical protein
MLVSGGKVIAIDSIKKGNTNKDTLSGDGVWTNLGVNTDVIATTKKLNDTKSELESKINSASSALSGEIKKKQDELKFELNDYNKITAIGPKNGTTTALAGGSNVVVSAGANTRVDTSSAGEQTIYTVNVTANPTNVTVSGENGLTARRDEGTSAYYLGLNNNYIQAITSVSSKLPITAFTTYSAAHKNDDVTPYTAGNYIEITNHKIIGHDWTNTIKSASSNSVTTVESRFKGDGSSYSGYNGKPFIDNTTPKWSVVGDGNRISVTSANNKYGVSWNGEGIATEDWVLGKNYLPKDVASSTYLTIASANEIYQKKLNAGAGIVIKNETDISVDISVSGDIIPYSAGEGIGIDNHIVSITADYLSANALKDLSGRWESAANALEASADNWNKTYKDVSDSAKYWNSAYDALASADKWNTTYERVELSGDEWDKVTDKLDSATFKTYSALMEQKLIDLDDKNLDVSAFSSVSSDFALKTEVQEEFEQTSAWVKDNFLSANALDNLSGNWESTYKTVETNSAKWETAYETLTSNSADWDEVSAKLNSATFATYSADIKSTIERFSSEFVELSGDFTAHSADSDLHLSAGEREKWTSAANRVENSAAIWDTVSAKVNNTDFEEFKTSAHYELEKKLDKNAFESWSANKDYDFYSAGNGIKIENHIVSVSADYALSADVDNRLEEYYDKTEVDELIANFGGYTTATSAEPDGHPNVSEIDPRRIYLVKMASGPTSADNYKEWIYIDTAWNCVGETTMDLTPYLTKEEAAHTYQPSGYYVTSSTDVIKPGSAWVLVNDDNNIQWSGLDISQLGKKYIVKSTNGTIGVGSATVGNVVTYDLSGAKIVGENGVSAEYNPATNEWNVGLEEQTYCYAEAQSQNTTTTGLTEVLSNFENINMVGDDIVITPTTITLNKGLYHIDIQVNVTNTATAPQYYDVSLTNSLNNGALTKVFDGSFTHTETLDLSFDVKLLNNSNSLTFTLTNMPIGSEYYVRNLQIHEIVTIDGLLNIAGGQYTGGTAIGISNENVINVKYDSMSGIGVTPNNELYVKLGKGLSFSNEGGVDGSLSLDEVTEEVVETVQSLQQELDNKLTTNMNISDAKDIGNMFKNNTVASLACSLFTVPLQHNLTTASEISFFTTQGMNQSNSFPIIIGLYEYNFDYFDPETHQYRSQTTWLGDTGPIMNDTQDVKGHAIGGGPNKYTFKLKHLTPVVSADIEYDGRTYHNEYGPVMRSDRAYYLAVFARHTDGLSYVLGDAGYNAVTNSDPFISWYADNMHYVYPDKTSATMDDNWNGWGNDLSLSAIDFWNRGGEANAIVRPLVMIRNVSE